MGKAFNFDEAQSVFTFWLLKSFESHARMLPNPTSRSFHAVFYFILCFLFDIWLFQLLHTDSFWMNPGFLLWSTGNWAQNPGHTRQMLCHGAVSPVEWMFIYIYLYGGVRRQFEEMFLPSTIWAHEIELKVSALALSHFIRILFYVCSLRSTPD